MCGEPAVNEALVAKLSDHALDVRVIGLGRGGAESERNRTQSEFEQAVATAGLAVVIALGHRPSEDLDLMIQAILIQRQIGGNLAVILDTIVQTIRDRGRIQRQVSTLTAQGRLSGMVIGALPFVLGVLIYMIEPDYIGTLFRHPVGIGLLAGGLVSGAVGFVFIRKMTMIEV